MSKIIPATTYISPDEKAMGLYEFNLRSPSGKMCRYEIIHIIRNDRIAEYRRKMKDFKSIQIRIPSYMEHTINELREMANDMRDNPPDLKEVAKLDKVKIC